MADNEVIVREIQWGRILSVGQITRAFRIAIWPPSKLLLCLLALAITIGSGMLLDLGFKTQVFGQSFSENMQSVFSAAMGQGTNWDVRNILSFQGFYYGPLDALTAMAALIGAYWQASPWFAMLNTLIAILVWAFFGGAVSRMAAVQFARDERIGLMAAVRFSCKRYLSLAGSPLAMFVVICLIALPTFFVAALVLLIPFGGEVVAGLLFFMAMVLGVLLALLFLFGTVGLGLQLPAIAAEGRDAFDAISRSVGYVLARPWKYILYTLFSIFYLCVTFVLVRLFAFLVLKLPYVFLKATWLGARTDGTPDKLSQVWVEPSLTDLFTMPQSDGVLHFSAVLMAIVIFILLGMMISFIPSFVLSSQTIIYFLMRRLVDFKDLNEVFMEEEQQESGLARLEKTSETNVEPEPAAEGDEAAEPQADG